MEMVKRPRYYGNYGAGGPYAYNPVMRRAGKRYARRRTYGRTGRTRRAGFYGRFGTGRGRRAQIEKKFLDTTLNPTVDLTAENVGQLTLIPQGATQSQRVGYKCVLKSIQWRCVYNLPAGATGNDTVYMYIVQDTQTNGAAAATTDVWTTAFASSMLRNIQNGDRFKILAKEKVDLNANAGVAAAFDGDIKCTEGFLKLNIPLVFNGATGAITEHRSNSISVFLGSTASDDVITTTLNFRIRYTDQ